MDRGRKEGYKTVGGLNYVECAEPHKFHACLHQTACSYKSKMHLFLSPGGALDREGDLLLMQGTSFIQMFFCSTSELPPLKIRC